MHIPSTPSGFREAVKSCFTYIVAVRAASGEFLSPAGSRKESGRPHKPCVPLPARVAGNADLYVISADGGKPRRLTTEASEDIVPSFSHDGNWIYFCSNRSGGQQIWKQPAAGGQAVQITQQGGFDNVESPDGQ